MPQEQPRRKPTARRYTPEEKAQAVRLVRQLRAELGADHGTVQRIAGQLGYGVAPRTLWPGGTSAGPAEVCQYLIGASGMRRSSTTLASGGGRRIRKGRPDRWRWMLP